MESLFIQLSDVVEISILKKLTLMTGFVVQGNTLTHSPTLLYLLGSNMYALS